MAWKPHRKHIEQSEQLLGMHESESGFDPNIALLGTLITLGETSGSSPRPKLEARQSGLIKLPKLTEDELGDRNKGDLLVKLLALMQVTWMVVRLVARAASPEDMAKVNPTPENLAEERPGSAGAASARVKE
ncbi:hypothetical protein B0H67DRAFT_640754 [Lasiosphaeris hirsuta]|uniref:Uncharacterized protein n=1 Tax=Lasiosphaeris hirsuta TaxID=260670 RepID=A0AA40AY70_9PEZI|nr:hypothetical protein B0H67DRAFT_640754 [Lasiosphaeris hirsuta]